MDFIWFVDFVVMLKYLWLVFFWYRDIGFVESIIGNSCYLMFLIGN